jgi:hypothetical protein
MTLPMTSAACSLTNRRTAPRLMAGRLHPAIVDGEMRRFDDARAELAKLKKMRPDDPDVPSWTCIHVRFVLHCQLKHGTHDSATSAWRV